MMCHRLLPFFLIAWTVSGQLCAQSTSSGPQPSSEPSSEAHILAMTVPSGTPLQIALDKEVRVKRAGQPITGRVMQPVYVFDHLVIPVGTMATGSIVSIAPIAGRTRALHALNEDFTPAHPLTVA